MRVNSIDKEDLDHYIISNTLFVWIGELGGFLKERKLNWCLGEVITRREKEII